MKKKQLLKKRTKEKSQDKNYNDKSDKNMIKISLK